jgi:CBS domain containing-hemolysin-like protein
MNPTDLPQMLPWSEASGIIWTHLGVIATLLVGSAFFSGSESALFSLDRFALEKIAETSGRRGRTLQRLLDEPRRLLATLLVGNEIINVSISAVGAHLVFSLWTDPEGAPWWLNIVMVTPLLLLFGEIVPKVVAVRTAPAWSRLVVLPLATFGVLVAPVRMLLQAIADLLLAGFVEENDPLPDAVKEDQFKALVDLGEMQGVLGASEAQMIHRVFDLSDTPVARIMTSRADLVSLSINSPLEEFLERATNPPHSRIPVHSGEPDAIRGVLLTKDLLSFRWGKEQFNPRSLQKLLGPAYFVPPGKPADELLREFQQTRGHMAVVIDEYGAVQGLVTMQDVLDELFAPFHGEVLDVDTLDGRPRIEDLGEGVFRVPARLEVAEWNRRMSPALPEGDSFTTVAGYIFHLFGRLPQKGERTRDEHWTFQVSGVEGTRLTQFTVTRRNRDVPGGGSPVPRGGQGT